MWLTQKSRLHSRLFDETLGRFSSFSVGLWKKLTLGLSSVDHWCDEAEQTAAWSDIVRAMQANKSHMPQNPQTTTLKPHPPNLTLTVLQTREDLPRKHSQKPCSYSWSIPLSLHLLKHSGKTTEACADYFSSMWYILVRSSYKGRALWFPQCEKLRIIKTEFTV